MKVVFVTSYGFNAQMRNFLEYILARLLVKNGATVLAFAKPEIGEKAFYELDGVRIYKPRSFVRGVWYLAGHIIFSRPDLIHVFNARNNRFGAPAAILAKILNIPLMFTEKGLLHDHYLVTDRDDPFPYVEKVQWDRPIMAFKKVFRDKNVIGNLRNYIFHLPMSLADKVIFVSKHNLEIARKLGIKDFQYLPYIFDEEIFKTGGAKDGDTERLSILKKYGGGNPILFVGQLKLRKGWDIILEAMPLIEKNLDARLIFITSGTDQETPELTKKIENLGIRNQVIFLGTAGVEVLRAAYKNCKMVIVPSRYEGFGLAVIEAWEMGKPVIASDVPAINEHVENNRNGILVPPKDSKKLAGAINLLLKNKTLGEKLVKNGTETLNELKSTPQKNKWLEFYGKPTS